MLVQQALLRHTLGSEVSLADFNTDVLAWAVLEQPFSRKRFCRTTLSGEQHRPPSRQS
jgi:hypothetical protein